MQGRCVCLPRGPGPLRLRQNAWRANAVKPFPNPRCTRAQFSNVKVRIPSQEDDETKDLLDDAARSN